MMLKRRAIGIFPDYQVTELALYELRDNGFLMDQVSIVGRDINDHTEGIGVHTNKQLSDIDSQHLKENETGDAAKKGAVTGGTLGGLTGLLVGLGVIAIPAVGPVMLAGAAATAIATALSGGAIGAAAGSLVGGLVGLGLPEDHAKVYSDRVSQGNYLVLVEGSAADIVQAESIFRKHGILEWHVYDDVQEEVPTATTTF
jgi:uncharacterized membrane protein